MEGGEKGNNRPRNAYRTAEKYRPNKNLLARMPNKTLEKEKYHGVN